MISFGGRFCSTKKRLQMRGALNLYKMISAVESDCLSALECEVIYAHSYACLCIIILFLCLAHSDSVPKNYYHVY